MKKGISLKKGIFSDKQKLLRLIGEAGFTPTKIARALGVTYKSVYRWLNKKVRPHPVQSQAIDALFKEKVDITGLVYAVRRQFGRNPLKILRRNPKIRDKFFLDATYHSNAIAGSSLTRKETEQVVRGRIIKGKTLSEHLEAINHYNALVYMLDCIKPGFRITQEYILRLHSIITCRYGGIKETPAKMKRFLSVVNKLKPEIIKKVAAIHHNFENIHPFSDANGRVGRLIMITQLLNNGFAPAIIRIERKDKYYAACSKADLGEYQPLAQLICEAILKGYQ